MLIRLKKYIYGFRFSLGLWIRSKILKTPNAHIPSYDKLLCKFLKSRAEVDACTSFLQENGYLSHIVSAKDWDIAHILPEISDGNFLDMGSSDSYILKNVILKGIRGGKYGIDLRKPDIPLWGVKYIVGNLTNTKLPANFFKNITCLSVIEHDVDFANFAREVARLLQDHGKLFVTFDYWDPPVKSVTKLYGFNWQPLDKKSLTKLIDECNQQKLFLISDIDWSLGEAVITPEYHSPDSSSYTFGLIVFEKIMA